MNTLIEYHRLGERWKEAHRLVLTAAFEDSATCARVKDFCLDLSRELGDHCHVIRHVWVFSTFRMPELQDIAAEEAALSDVVIVAARHAEGLPEEVKSWIEKWLQQKGNRMTTLVALLDRAYDGAENPIRVYLQQVARTGGVDLMVDFGEG